MKSLLMPFVLLITTVSSADVIQVPADHGTIQAAFDSIPGTGGPDWEIHIAPGVYTENLQFTGKACRLLGLGALGAVKVDADMAGTALSVFDTPGVDPALR